MACSRHGSTLASRRRLLRAGANGGSRGASTYALPFTVCVHGATLGLAILAHDLKPARLAWVICAPRVIVWILHALLWPDTQTLDDTLALCYTARSASQ